MGESVKWPALSFPPTEAPVFYRELRSRHGEKPGNKRRASEARWSGVMVGPWHGGPCPPVGGAARGACGSCLPTHTFAPRCAARFNQPPPYQDVLPRPSPSGWRVGWERGLRWLGQPCCARCAVHAPRGARMGPGGGWGGQTCGSTAPHSYSPQSALISSGH